MASSTFHFSPRPNLANQIRWQPWAQAAFKQADRENKLILLTIGGVWCHWCHVMDETTYSNTEVIRLINDHFVSIRVDTDQRPDINERYNMGGWPTTALLTPTGELIAGATYVPADEFGCWLGDVNRVWQERKSEILEEIEKGISSERFQAQTDSIPALDLIAYQKVWQTVKVAFDRDHGGFGREPKFPMTEALTLAQDVYLVTGDQTAYEIFAKSLYAMSEGGMYDQVEGGFFRYSTTRDWSAPHYEKMLEDNALLLDNVISACAIVQDDERFDTVTQDMLRYLEDNLFQTETHCWSGVQDADEEYYNLPLEQRNQRQSPHIDQTIYVDRNAYLVRSLARAGAVLTDHHWLDRAKGTMGYLLENCYTPEQGMAHYHLRGKAELWGMLEDQSAVGRALNMLYQASGERRFLKQSIELAAWVMTHLTAPNGAFFDAVPDPTAPGALARPMQMLDTNARACRWLAELTAISGDDRYRSAAVKALRYWQTRYEGEGVMAAGFALAVADCTRSWATVHVIGTWHHQETQKLQQSAHRFVGHQVAVHLLDPKRDREEIERMSYSIDRPVAYVCQARQCLAPTDQPEIVVGQISEHLKGHDRAIYAKPNY